MKSHCKIYPNGTKIWFTKNYALHREDGPAAEYVDGRVFWWIEDREVYPETAVDIPEFIVKYPKLVEAMTVYLIHKL
jgi:hypothetical protein